MPCLKQLADGVQITVKVVPGSSRDRVAGLMGDALKIQVSAPPEKGKANAAVITLLAKALGVGIKRLAVAKGQTSPRKTIFVTGLTVEEVRTRLSL